MTKVNPLFKFQARVKAIFFQQHFGSKANFSKIFSVYLSVIP
jgi:hypothetical protein